MINQMTRVEKEPLELELSDATENSKLSEDMSVDRKLGGPEKSLPSDIESRLDEFPDCSRISKFSIDGVGDAILLLYLTMSR